MSDFITCSSCGAENPSDFAFCEDCGAPLQGDLAPTELEPLSMEVEAEGNEEPFADEFDGDPSFTEAGQEGFEAHGEEPSAEVTEWDVAADEGEEEDYDLAEGSDAAFDGDFRTEAEDGEDESFHVAGDGFKEESEPQAPAPPAIEPRRSTEPYSLSASPLPEPGGFDQAPRLVVFQGREAQQTLELSEDSTVLGQELLEGIGIAAEQVIVFKQNKNLTLYVVSPAATQLNEELLSLGDRRPLRDGDVILLGEETGLRLQL